MCIKGKNIHDYHETKIFCREKIWMFFSIFSYHEYYFFYQEFCFNLQRKKRYKSGLTVVGL